ncbi:acetyl-CoA carboxylase biotin carboxyl carrier protein [Streptococcus rupicaprae]|uniref:Biotin carboxyl carrier protein of acetyl-CoA carboxylase n=2 Tax=Streptococcus TaxID=1301 RepID=A0A7X6MYQ0_9STRE|nr:acetyl-CoA carboxylase biotin carboxyl carrier protein [Streptococcus ovuberis]NKZ20159.1 acetyl-CoA carboxylase biotin carboxyl carrier protein [Streptococcus ovuberis]
MNLENIKELVAIFENSSLSELTLEEGDRKISLGRKLTTDPIVTAAPMATSHNSLPAEDDDNDEDFVTSPIVGTFYSAAGPDIPAFARVGDKLKAGQTICIVEAMKLMNELTVDFDCEVEAILVSNEQKVEYGQPLFRIKKL